MAITGARRTQHRHFALLQQTEGRSPARFGHVGDPFASLPRAALSWLPAESRAGGPKRIETSVEVLPVRVDHDCAFLTGCYPPFSGTIGTARELAAFCFAGAVRWRTEP